MNNLESAKQFIIKKLNRFKNKNNLSAVKMFFKEKDPITRMNEWQQQDQLIGELWRKAMGIEKQ